MINQALEKAKKADWWTVIYLLLFGIVVARDFLATTMYQIDCPSWTSLSIYAALAIYAAGVLFVRRIANWKEIIFGGLIVAIFCIASVCSGYHFLITLAFLIVGAKGNSFDKILKVYFWVCTACTLFAFISAELGIIENLVYEREMYDGSVRLRHSFGSIYPTDFAAHIFFMVLAGIYLYSKYIGIKEVIVITISAGALYYLCDAKNSAGSIVIFGVIALVLQLLNKLVKGELLDKIYRVLAPIGVLFVSLSMVLMCHFYDLEVDWMYNLNLKMSMRYRYGSIGVHDYGYRWFGQFVNELGYGASLDMEKWYFFIDSSYERIFLEYGILVFVLVVLLLIFQLEKAINKKQFILIAALIAVILQCYLEQHLMEVAYNPFIIMLFADLEKRKK